VRPPRFGLAPMVSDLKPSQNAQRPHPWRKPQYAYAPLPAGQTAPARLLCHERVKMPALKNPRHEAFAQALARGMSASAEYVEAGYKASTTDALG
jgi:hypothetical protein